MSLAETRATAGDSYDFDARLYDARLVRFLSIDPQFSKFPDLTPYNGLGNSPLIFIDPSGEILRLAGNKTMAFKDLQNILPEKYQSKIRINKDGTIKFKISKNRVQKINDPGVSLLKNLVDSKKSYVYEVNNKGRAIQHSSGTEEIIDFSDPTHGTNGLINASTTPNEIVKIKDVLNSNLRTGKIAYKDVPFGFKPMDGNDGHVILSETGQWKENPTEDNKNGEVKPRASVVLHELQEVYNKTDLGQYYDKAHENAENTEKSLPDGDSRKSANPGRIINYEHK